MKNKTITYMVIFSLLSFMSLLSTVITSVSAASLTNVSDTLSDAGVSDTATHTIVFVTQNTINSGATGQITVTFDEAGGSFDLNSVSADDITCPTGVNWGTKATSANSITCGNPDGNYNPATTTIVVADIDNPGSTGSYQIDIETSNDGGSTVLDNGSTMVAIVDDVTVSATVEATLTFEIAPTSSATIDGVATTDVGATSSTSSLQFGILSPGASKTLAQQLSVITNAVEGYTVTVQQDGDLQSAAGDDIDTFIDGSAATATSWASPSATLGDEDTYGHFGVTYDDDTMSSAGLAYGDGEYRGLDGTNPAEVMYHDGPADGQTADKGKANAAYTIEITNLQEAGDYTNTLTYVCTPTY